MTTFGLAGSLPSFLTSGAADGLSGVQRSVSGQQTVNRAAFIFNGPAVPDVSKALISVETQTHRQIATSHNT
jgi:hypothetical protein